MISNFYCSKYKTKNSAAFILVVIQTQGWDSVYYISDMSYILYIKQSWNHRNEWLFKGFNSLKKTAELLQGFGALKVMYSHNMILK